MTSPLNPPDNDPTLADPTNADPELNVSGSEQSPGDLSATPRFDLIEGGATERLETEAKRAEVAAQQALRVKALGRKFLHFVLHRSDTPKPGFFTPDGSGRYGSDGFPRHR